MVKAMKKSWDEDSELLEIICAIIGFPRKRKYNLYRGFVLLKEKLLGFDPIND
jgi:hypothetical protein